MSLLAPQAARPPAGRQRPLREALALCGAHLRFAILFSALLNVLYLAPTLYMLQVYDRVVPTRGHLTLLFLTIVLLLALSTLSLLDLARSRLLVRAGVRLELRRRGRCWTPGSPDQGRGATSWSAADVASSTPCARR